LVTDGEQRRDLVVRLRPPAPGLLEPYDLRRQFDVLRALEPTPVRAPRALWIEETGEVLGRPFYVMERSPGRVHERDLPPELRAAPDRVAAMSERILEQIAAIHLVDVEAAGLSRLGDGHDHLARELAHWTGEVDRVRRGPLPALDRLADELRTRQPEPTPRATLVHGDAKPGNFAFVDDEVSAVFDWEMTAIGDPMTDLGWAEVAWQITPAFARLPRGHFDALLDRYQALTGIAVHDRAWYRALGAYKMAVILLLGSMLVDAGHSDDPRYVEMGMGCPFITSIGLAALGIDDRLEAGPVMPRDERLAAIRTSPC
jgi:aminoglycoside phosphotransferase (APT) family kinase protein